MSRKIALVGLVVSLLTLLAPLAGTAPVATAQAPADGDWTGTATVTRTATGHHVYGGELETRSVQTWTFGPGGTGTYTVSASGKTPCGGGVSETWRGSGSGPYPTPVTWRSSGTHHASLTVGWAAGSPDEHTWAAIPVGEVQRIDCGGVAHTEPLPLLPNAEAREVGVGQFRSGIGETSVTYSHTYTRPLSEYLVFGESVTTITASYSRPSAGTLRTAPTGLTFGEQVVGTVSEIQRVTVTNPGRGPVVLQDPVLSGEHPGDFWLSSGSCVPGIRLGEPAAVIHPGGRTSGVWSRSTSPRRFRASAAPSCPSHIAAMAARRSSSWAASPRRRPRPCSPGSSAAWSRTPRPADRSPARWSRCPARRRPKRRSRRRRS